MQTILIEDANVIAYQRTHTLLANDRDAADTAGIPHRRCAALSSAARPRLAPAAATVATPCGAAGGNAVGAGDATRGALASGTGAHEERL